MAALANKLPGKHRAVAICAHGVRTNVVIVFVRSRSRDGTRGERENRKRFGNHFRRPRIRVYVPTEFVLRRVDGQRAPVLYGTRVYIRILGGGGGRFSFGNGR